MSYFDIPTPGQPEVFLGNSPALIGTDGRIHNEATITFVREYIERFTALVEQHAAAA